MKVNRIGIGFATAMLVISSAGCGKIADKATKKVTEKGLEKTIESQTGGKVDVDAKGGGFKVETKDGSKVQMGGSASLPAGWPKILELPKGFEVNMATTTKDDETPRKSVMATGKGDGAKIFATYKTNLESAGYEIESESSADTGGGNQMRQLSAESGKSNVSVTVSTDDKKVVVSLGVTTSTDQSDD